MAAGTIRSNQTGAAPNQATDIYGDANDNKSLFNVRSQPVIAHWVEWFGRPDSCNYPSVFCQTGRGAESTSIRLANVPSLIHSFSSETFLWFREGQESTQPVGFALPTADMSLEMFPTLDFFYILWEMLGHLVCGQTFLSTHFPLKFMFSSCNDSEPLMCSTEVRPSNTIGCSIMCVSLCSVHRLCVFVDGVWGDRLFLFRIVCTACSYSVHC